MTGVFERAMGPDFHRLHPMMRRRFGVSLEAGYACVGRGVMESVRRGPWWTVPFLQIGRLRNILIPIAGRDVPFAIFNYPYRDPFGRETVTFVREYWAGERYGRFDATMIYSERARRVIDYLGTHQHLPVDLDLEVTENGGLVLRSGDQRFYEGLLGFRFPMLFSGRAELREHFDDDLRCYVIDLEVRNRVFGFLFGYRGRFECEFPDATDAPTRLKPVRHERRE